MTQNYSQKIDDEAKFSPDDITSISGNKTTEDEALLAKLVDYDDSSPTEPNITSNAANKELNPTDVPPQSTQPNVVEQSELFDDSDDPIKGQTKPSLSRNPFAKGGLAGVLLLIGFGGAGLFLTNANRNKPSPAPSMTYRVIPTTTPKPTPNPDAEIGNLKTQVALAQQEQQIKSIDAAKGPKTQVQRNPDPLKPAPTKASKASKPPMSNQTQPLTDTPPQERYTALPRYRPVAENPPQSGRASPRIAPASPVAERSHFQTTKRPSHISTTPPKQVTVPTPTRTPVSTSPLPSSSGTSNQPIDPQQQWQALAQIGSYSAPRKLPRQDNYADNANNPASVPSRTTSVATSTKSGNIATPSSTTPPASVSVMQIPRAIPVGSPASSFQLATVPAPGGIAVPTLPPSLNSSSLTTGTATQERLRATVPILPRNLQAYNTSAYSQFSHPQPVVVPSFNSPSSITDTPDQEQFHQTKPALPQSKSAPISGTPTEEPLNRTPQTLPHSQSAPLKNTPAVQVNPAEEASILNGTRVRQLQIGAIALGQLITPVIWSGTTGSNNIASAKSADATSGQNFTVQLVEPLQGKDGSVALSAGTQIVARLVDVNSSGLVQLQPTAVVVDGQEYILPPDAISIRGKGGEPLLASKWGKDATITTTDLNGFMLGALSRVGQVLTQPESQTSSSTNGIGFNQTTTSSSGGRNLWGAILDGGFTPLAQAIQTRNQQAIQDIRSRPDIWLVKADKEVEVFVNRSFEI